MKPARHSQSGSAVSRILLLLLVWMLSAIGVLVHHDNHSSLPILSATPNIPASEMNALYHLYTATNGPHWEWSDDPAAGIEWNFTDPLVNNPCVDHWQGINCSLSSPFKYYYVEGLKLLSYNLAGTLPDSLDALQRLQYIVLGPNRLTGPIPASLGNLTNLQFLYLGDNLLTKTIPVSLGNLTNLQFLYLGENHLTGTVPAFLSNLINLQGLYLYDNRLTGIIPASLGNLFYLQGLDLSENQLTGTVPASLGNLINLQGLDLSENHLTGTTPASLGNLFYLIRLDLSDNKLTETIPASLGNLMNLQALDLSDNKLSGTIPASLSNQTKLQYLYLAENHLTGTIPASLGSLVSLQYMRFNTNQLTGIIPASLGQLASLLFLYLYSNRLTGSIPELRNLLLMQHLYLDSNRLTGPMPSSLGNLINLNMLRISANLLTYTIPSSLGNLTSLVYMCLDNNQLTGTIPASLGQLASLQYLYLYSNRFTGSIPELRNLLYMQYLYLYSNKLTGSIPESLGTLTILQDLNLYSNELTGSIPASLGNLTNLQNLNLNTNRLTGIIPALSTISRLITVQVHNNRLTGNLDDVFDDLLQLEMIVLNNNQLTGTLPEALFKLKLQSFSAISNCFRKPLPITTICRNNDLTNLILDGLSSGASCENKLFDSTYTVQYDIGGSIPTCLFQLPNINTLHLSSNGFTGSIPADIVLSSTLTDLSLSHNALTGSIPEQIQLKQWSNIDLSYNRLSGTLSPDFVSNGSVELVNNRLSGIFPASFRTLHNISVLGSNMFSCSYDESELPQHDPQRRKYHCGSNAFNSIYFAWLGATVCTIVLLGSFGWKYGVIQYSFRNNPVLVSTSLYTSLGIVCKLSLTAACYSILVLLPLYSVNNAMYGTQTYKYAYQVSAVLASGVVPFALYWGFWLLLIMSITVLATKLLHTMPVRGIEKQGLEPAVIQSNKRAMVFIFLPYLVLDCIVVVGANAAYVYVAVYKNSSLLLAVQTLLAVFKVVWGTWALPSVLSFLTGREKYGTVQTVIQVVINILNNIVIPCLVVAAISPNCFYYVAVAAPAVLSIAVSSDCTEIDSVTHQCVQYTTTLVPASFQPPYTYSYQCSSSLITYYSPAFMSMCIVSTFVTPLTHYICQWFYNRSTPGTYWNKLLHRLLPRIMKPVNSSVGISDSGYLNSNDLLTTLIGTLALILTFGVMFPPLCVAFAVSVLASVFLFRINVRRFISSTAEEQRDKTVEILRVQCDSAESMEVLKHSVWVLVTISCWFYTLFLFDTLGDAVGFEGAYWVLIVMPLMPLVLYGVYYVMYKYCIPVTGWSCCANSVNIGPDRHIEDGAEVEMQCVSVVHNVLV